MVLYYGSFRNLARTDSKFDWEAEIRETIEHEVKHHLESLADTDVLGEVDYALDEDFRRSEGLEWDAWYYQRAEAQGGGIYAAEDHVFLEQVWTGADFQKAEEIRFQWRGREYRIPRPSELGDLHYVWLEGVQNAPPALEIVLVRKRWWWEDVKRLLGTSLPVVHETELRAIPVRVERDEVS